MREGGAAPRRAGLCGAGPGQAPDLLPGRRSAGGRESLAPARPSGAARAPPACVWGRARARAPQTPGEGARTTEHGMPWYLTLPVCVCVSERKRARLAEQPFSPASAAGSFATARDSDVAALSGPGAPAEAAVAGGGEAGGRGTWMSWIFGGGR